MSYAAEPRVDAYIDALPGWQQAICREVRDLVHAADPEVAETIKRTSQPYFVLQGNICALLAAKDHVNVFLYDGAIVPDPEGIITAGHVRRGRVVPRPELQAAAMMTGPEDQDVSLAEPRARCLLRRDQLAGGHGVTGLKPRHAAQPGDIEQHPWSSGPQRPQFFTDSNSPGNSLAATTPRPSGSLTGP
jgi:hypothetical protein